MARKKKIPIGTRISLDTRLINLIKWLFENIFHTETFINIIALMMVTVMVYKELNSMSMSSDFVLLIGLVIGHFFRRSMKQ